MSDVNLATAAPLFLPLFTGVRGETVWKIVMGPSTEVPEALERGQRDPDRPLVAAKEARLRALGLFSKQFRKEYSPKFTGTGFSEGRMTQVCRP